MSVEHFLFLGVEIFLSDTESGKMKWSAAKEYTLKEVSAEWRK